MSYGQARRSARYRIAATAAAVFALVAAFLGASAHNAGSAHAAATLLSQGKPATASSLENAGFPASNAVDGNTATRWSSQFSDPQWLE
ncbi:MAG TPA: discoidin domain-containing protein, partial [Streptosporangiaceae bacterium]